MTAPKTKTDTKTETDVVVTTDGRKVTWSYERKVNRGNYESESMGIYITDHCPEDEPSVVAWASTYNDTVANTIKPMVWDSLNLEYGFDTNGVPGLIAPTPPPAPVAPPPFTPTTVQPGGPRPQPQQRSYPGQQPSMAQYGVYADPPGFCKECGQTEFYDNRQTGDANIMAGKPLGADWKCKNPSCEKRYYRPGSYPYNQALKGGGGVPPPSTAPPVPVPQAPAQPIAPMHIPPEPEAPAPDPDTAPF